MAKKALTRLLRTLRDRSKGVEYKPDCRASVARMKRFESAKTNLSGLENALVAALPEVGSFVDAFVWTLDRDPETDPTRVVRAAIAHVGALHDDVAMLAALEKRYQTFLKAAARSGPESSKGNAAYHLKAVTELEWDEIALLVLARGKTTPRAEQLASANERLRRAAHAYARQEGAAQKRWNRDHGKKPVSSRRPRVSR